VNYRRALAAEIFAGLRKGDYFRMFGEQRVHRALQIADAFAMDDPDAQDPAFLARREVIVHETFYFTRLKRVQIQYAVNRQLNRLVHFSSYSYCLDLSCTHRTQLLYEERLSSSGPSNL
jgi:hypothetical protein